MATYFTFNGFGTTYYGKCDFSSDGSYISTLWITILYFPVLPLSSAVLMDVEENYYGAEYGMDASFKARFNSIKISPCYPQVIRTWLFAFSFIPVILHHYGLFDFLRIPPAINIALYLYPLIILPLPWLLRRRARRKAYQLPPRKRLNLLY